MCKGSRLQSHKRLMKQKGSTSERYVKTIQGSRYVLFIKKYRPLVPDSKSSPPSRPPAGRPGRCTPWRQRGRGRAAGRRTGAEREEKGYM